MIKIPLQWDRYHRFGSSKLFFFLPCSVRIKFFVIIKSFVISICIMESFVAITEFHRIARSTIV